MGSHQVVPAKRHFGNYASQCWTIRIRAAGWFKRHAQILMRLPYVTSGVDAQGDEGRTNERKGARQIIPAA